MKLLNSGLSHKLKLSSLFFLTLHLLFINISINAQSSSNPILKGLYEEEINGDLKEAANIYSQIIQSEKYGRNIKSEALFHLGLVHEKMGSQDAIIYYQKIIQEYNDQKEVLKKTISRLGITSSKELDNISLISNQHILKSSPIFTKKKVEIPPVPIRTVSPNGRYFTFAGKHGNLAIYDRYLREEKILTPNPPSLAHGRSLGAKSISTRTVWSPDSEKIAYYWVRSDEGDDLRVFDLASNSYKVIYSFDGSGTPYPFEWTPDGQHLLAEIRNKSTNQFKIVLLNVSDGQYKTLVELPNNDRRKSLVWASLSPNGQYLLYDDLNKENNWDITLVDLTTNQSHQILHNLGINEKKPLWLSNNNFLYFSDKSNTSGLWKVGLNDNYSIESSELIVEGLGWLYHHVGKTMDGSYYYWSHIRILDLYSSSIDVDNGTLGKAEIIESQNLEQRIGPQWSQAGNKIIYLRINENPLKNYLEIFDLINSKEQPLNISLDPDQRLTYHPVSWSPNEEKLLITLMNSSNKPGTSYFSGNTSEVIEYEFNSNSTVKILTNASLAKYGTYGSIFFLRDNKLIEKLNDQETIIFNDKNLIIHMFSVSPDNKYIALLAGTRKKRAMDQLLIIDLEDNSLCQILTTANTDRFDWNLDWISSNNNLIYTKSKQGGSQRTYIYDLHHQEEVSISEEIFNEDLKLRNISMHPIKDELIFVRRKNSINLWVLNNF